MSEFLAIFNASFIAALLRMSVTYMLAGLAYSICARTGIIDLALEGKILGGAFVAVWFCYKTGSPTAGVIAAVIFMGIMSLLAAIPIVILGANHVVVGTGLNFVMQGLTTVGISIIWNRAGTTDQVAQLSSRISKYLSSFGNSAKFIFAMQTPILYFGIVLIMIAWIVIYRTRIGLRMRAIGENTPAADSLGINVRRYQLLALMISGMLCGLAGADLSIGRLNYFTKEMSAGRGWISLAVGILGQFNPAYVLLSALMIGGVEALQIRLQSAYNVPSQLFQIIPYVVPILILAGFGGVKLPSWLGKPYKRSERN